MLALRTRAAGSILNMGGARGNGNYKAGKFVGIGDTYDEMGNIDSYSAPTPAFDPSLIYAAPGYNIQPTIYASPGPTNTGFPQVTTGDANSWGNILSSDLNGILGAAAKILTTRYAVPQLQAGTSIKTATFQGTALPVGSYGNSMSALSSDFGGLSSGMLPLLLIGGVVLLMVKK